MLPAGAYRDQKVRIERRPAVAAPYTYSQADQGAWSSATTVATRAAAFRPDVLRKQIEGNRLVSNLLGVVTLRRDSTIDTVTITDRMVLLYAPYANKTMQIHSIMATPDGQEVEFAVEESKD